MKNSILKFIISFIVALVVGFAWNAGYELFVVVFLALGIIRNLIDIAILENEVEKS